MRTALLLFLLFLAACNPGSSPKERSTAGFSKEQLKITQLLDEYKKQKYRAPNDIVKDELRDSFIKRLDRYLSDTLNFTLPNFNILVDQVEVSDIGDMKAFYARFYDNDNYEFASVSNNEYWMEFDYDKDDAGKLNDNPAYKLLRTMPENADTVLSFMYMGDLKWEDPVSDRLKIRVIPFPKNFNFDSARSANKIQLNKK